MFAAEVLIWRNASNVKNHSVIEIGGKSSNVGCAQVSVSLFQKVFLFCLCNDKHALLLSSRTAQLKYFDVKLW